MIVELQIHSCIFEIIQLFIALNFKALIDFIFDKIIKFVFKMFIKWSSIFVSREPDI